MCCSTEGGCSIASAKKFGNGKCGAHHNLNPPQFLWPVTIALHSTVTRSATMAEAENQTNIPVSEPVLRDLAKNASKAIPQFEEKEAITGVK